MMFRTLMFAAAWAACAGASLAQTPGASADDEAVIVRADRLEEAVHAFVEGLSVEAGGEDELARFASRVCPGVAGLRGAQNQAIADRIAIRALEVDLDVGEPGCRANVFVLVATDADRIAQELYQHYPDLIGRYSERGVNTRGRGAMAAFLTDTRPVRWWHVSRTLSADGGPEGQTRQGGTPTSFRNRAPSRITHPTREAFQAAIIIVDGRQVGDVPVGVLGDYVAMVALAQLDPDADTAAFPTILNLFSQRAGGAAGPRELTAWDQAYLEGLYTAPLGHTARTQGRSIERAIVEGAN